MHNVEYLPRKHIRSPGESEVRPHGLTCSDLSSLRLLCVFSSQGGPTIREPVKGKVRCLMYAAANGSVSEQPAGGTLTCSPVKCSVTIIVLLMEQTAPLRRSGIINHRRVHHLFWRSVTFSGFVCLHTHINWDSSSDCQLPHQTWKQVFILIYCSCSLVRGFGETGLCGYK